MFKRELKFPSNKSFFLLGPRGTGKTTWVKNTFSDAIYIDLLEAEVFNQLLANPQRLNNFIPRGFSDRIIIDEIQRVPELLNEVHRLIELKKYTFILTGSSARKLRRTGQNLLGGRALTLLMHPLSSTELGNAFNLEHSLNYGHLPDTFSDDDPTAYLKSYVTTYLEEEIRQEGLTRNLSAFTRFLETASFSQGSLLNISSVARECSIERKTAENYFEILEDLLIAYRIPVFTKRAKRRLTSHPKFYFFDTGVYRSIRPMGILDSPEEAEGISFETLFLQELITQIDNYGFDFKVYYWRTSTNLEVDFVLYGEKGLLAFEVKRTSRINGNNFKGLKAFKNEYNPAKLFYIYGGERHLSEEDINIIPMHDALKKLPDILSKGLL